MIIFEYLQTITPSQPIPLAVIGLLTRLQNTGRKPSGGVKIPKIPKIPKVLARDLMVPSASRQAGHKPNHGLKISKIPNLAAGSMDYPVGIMSILGILG